MTAIMPHASTKASRAPISAIAQPLLMTLTPGDVQVVATGKRGSRDMTESTRMAGGNKRNWWRIVAWSAAGGLILLPLVAMQFTSEVNWTGADFAFAIVMFGGVGLLFELAVRLSSNMAYRAGMGVALLAFFLLVWINLAVGIIGSEDNDANQMFVAVPTIAIGGALIAHFRPRGMMVAMIAAAVAQFGVAIAALVIGAGFIFPITAMFAGLWMTSAWLFAKAAREG
jgi:hypothetical protein